jgi:hypothetical protein
MHRSSKMYLSTCLSVILDMKGSAYGVVYCHVSGMNATPVLIRSLASVTLQLACIGNESSANIARIDMGR